MIERLPEQVRTAVVARAVTSPSALLLAGAGMSAAILAGAALPVAAVAGAVAWAARVALAVPRRPPGDRVRPETVGEPWRSFVQDALRAQARFDATVDRARSGPLRERLEAIGRRLADGVDECWRIARQGDAMQAGIRELDPAAVQAELDELRDERRGRRDPSSRAALDRTEAALEAQLASAQRIATVARDAANRLRVLNAQLDEAVARSVELSLQTGDAGDLRPLTDDVEGLVGELESLRQAMEETGGAASRTGT